MMKPVTTYATHLFLLLVAAGSLLAQSQPAAQPLTKSAQAAMVETEPITTFYLANTSQPNDANEILTAIRIMVAPFDRVYLVPSRNAIVMRALPEDIQLTRKLIADLDRPRKTYRLTYVVSEMEAGKRVGLQRFSMVIAAGAKTELREGNRVPISTSSLAPGNTSGQAQVSYIDIGLNIQAALDQSTEGLNLRSKIEQSSVAEERSGLGTPDPIIRQTILEGTSSLVPGKALTLGSLDIPGSTRHLDVDAVLEPIRPF